MSVLDDILNPIPMKIEIPYYDDFTRVSNSYISYFMMSVNYYYRKMTGLEKQLDTSFFRVGTMTHKYLLEKEDFWKDYRISEVKAPSSANQKKFAELVVEYSSKAKDFGKSVIKAYTKSYSVKNKSEELIEKESHDLVTTLKDYIDELKSTDDRENISFYEVANLKEIEANIKKHKVADKLIYPQSGEIHSELHINWIHEKTNLECKSLLDRVTIDHENKIIQLVDLKTTRSIIDFKTSMVTYGYFRQASFYKMALSWWFTNVLKKNINEYKFISSIVAISTDNITKNEVRVFNISDEYIDKYSTQIDNILEELKWHYDNGKWEHSKDYYKTGIDTFETKWEI